MTEAIGIGFFQFDNLVKNRVPFCLFLMGVECSLLYKGQELDHIERYGLKTDLSFSAQSAKSELEAKKYRPMDPVVFVCSDGKLSKVVADELGAFGFMNCFFVEGGFRQLVNSSQEEKLF